MLWVDPDTGTYRVWDEDNLQWVEVSGSGSEALHAVGDPSEKPADPPDTFIWVDTDDESLGGDLPSGDAQIWDADNGDWLNIGDRHLIQNTEPVLPPDRLIWTNPDENLAPEAALLPLGVVLPYAGLTAPAGFLLCDGAPYSRTGYAGLFSQIGTTFGAGDGTTTFNVPDMRGRFPIGLGTLDTDTYGMGAVGGEARHVLQPGEGPIHTHTVNPPSTTSGGRSVSHTHNIDPPTTASGGKDANHDHVVTLNTSSRPTASGAHGHTQETRLATGSGATGTDQTMGVTSASDTGQPHIHNVNIPAFDSGGDTPSHTPSIDIAQFNTGSTPAATTAHENRPPYLGLNFIIKATSG